MLPREPAKTEAEARTEVKVLSFIEVVIGSLVFMPEHFSGSVGHSTGHALHGSADPEGALVLSGKRMNFFTYEKGSCTLFK
jgi:hypothetical protein